MKHGIFGKNKVVFKNYFHSLSTESIELKYASSQPLDLQ